MASLSISLKPTLLVKLDECAEKFGYTKSKIAENAISRYLEELEEDRADYQLAEKAWFDFVSNGEKTYTLTEVEKEFGL
ncbi:hypothetical protein [Treponema brennaborense]|uniref:CopG-like domain-containing protein DNA-binding n=1 Tax=Treponema brennaborense (strain DSM 12168 / CIP 105900 / DD5/3) TaxID=906968 RepID=F4LII2_TREBD|nr:hypothetical protein [Treponema brennaborense]AEE17207.1 hypothetical protein Trebr_1785 [Treponema brennaborense DSM 12168]